MKIAKLPLNFLQPGTDFHVQSGVIFKDDLYLSVSTGDPNGKERPVLAHIVKYDRKDTRWQIVHKSRFNAVPSEFHREAGFCCLKVHSGPRGKALGIMAVASNHESSVFLYADNANGFAPVRGCEKTPVQRLESYKGGVVAWMQQSGGNGPPSPVFFEDISRGHKQPIENLPIQNQGTVNVLNMALFQGHIYVSLGNEENGFQIWKSNRKRRVFKWKKVIDQGAYQFSATPFAPSMAVLEDALYIGTSQAAGSSAGDWPEEGAEIIRIFSDDSWQLVMGTSRFSPCGLQIPLSAYGRGFNVDGNANLTHLIAHKGALFAFIEENKAPNRPCHFQIWHSENGVQWSFCADRSAFEDAAEIDGILSMPFGVLPTGHFKTESDRPPMLPLMMV